MAKYVRSKIHTLNEAFWEATTPSKSTSTFRENGEITFDEFKSAGNFLVQRFPTWSWDASNTYLVTRHVPCHHRLVRLENDLDANETLKEGTGLKGDDEGWLDAEIAKPDKKADSSQSRSDNSGNVGGESADEEEIPDMDEDEDDQEAIIRNPKPSHDPSDPTKSSTITAQRMYDLYICYSNSFYTPKFYLSGYAASGQPLTYEEMKVDLSSDHQDSTISEETFPHSDPGVKMAQVHACSHANIMKLLLDKAEAAVQLRRERVRAKGREADMASLTSATKNLGISSDVPPKSSKDKRDHNEGAFGAVKGDDWEFLDSDSPDGTQGESNDEPAIRVDQYLIVFLKYMASIMPNVEWDSTMAI